VTFAAWLSEDRFSAYLGGIVSFLLAWLLLRLTHS